MRRRQATIPGVKVAALAAVSLLLPVAADAAVLASATFNSGTTLSANQFRSTYNGNLASINASGNLAVFWSGFTSQSNMFFDTTPADATPATATRFTGQWTASNPLTVSVDVKVASSGTGSSIGFMFCNPANENVSSTANLLALLNIDNGTSPNTSWDGVRFGGVLPTGATVVGLTGGPTMDSGIAAGSATFATVVARYWEVGTHAYLGLSVPSNPSFSFQKDMGASSAIAGGPEFGLRLYDSSSSAPILVDNFQVSGVIPEPTSLGLALTAGAFGLLRHRRR